MINSKFDLAVELGLHKETDAENAAKIRDAVFHAFILTDADPARVLDDVMRILIGEWQPEAYKKFIDQYELDEYGKRAYTWFFPIKPQKDIT